MDEFEELVEAFSKFPGIGSRQARRFAYYVLSRDSRTIAHLTALMSRAKKDTAVCKDCFRFYARRNPAQKACAICSDSSREANVLMVVSHDVDIEAVEKSGAYRGKYFVLGGTLPILEKKPETKIRINELKKHITAQKEISEVILALDAIPEGEYTSDFVRDALKGVGGRDIKITVLGRGLSTGTELEYSDPETIKSALSNRA